MVGFSAIFASRKAVGEVFTDEPDSFPTVQRLPPSLSRCFANQVDAPPTGKKDEYQF